MRSQRCCSSLSIVIVPILMVTVLSLPFPDSLLEAPQAAKPRTATATAAAPNHFANFIFLSPYSLSLINYLISFASGR